MPQKLCFNTTNNDTKQMHKIVWKKIAISSNSWQTKIIYTYDEKCKRIKKNNSNNYLIINHLS